ncbi:hypothetical protein NDU88_006841 [Pleurodeles waltl]|uniref:Uncharacterized protein n=1 Tax=Pleurodeles waltl TaxID=8319 RepID=A0AAV7SQT6_PLEWA|nr:hypothetical protein NDU88_006841 [Pleurodeles waltl]
MLTRSHPMQNRQAEAEALTRGAAQAGDTEVEGGSAPTGLWGLRSLDEKEEFILIVAAQPPHWSLCRGLRVFRYDMLPAQVVVGTRLCNLLFYSKYQ